MLQEMIRFMMSLKNYAENHGQKIINIFVLIDLKKEIKEGIVFVISAKNHISKQNLRRRLFDYEKVVFNKRQKRFGEIRRAGFITE